MKRVRKYFVVWLFVGLGFSWPVYAQNRVVDSLENVLKSSKKEKKLEILHQLTRVCFSINPSRAIKYAERASALAKELKSPEDEARALNDIAKAYFFQGDYENAEQYYFKSLNIYQRNGSKEGIVKTLNNIGVLYRSKGDYAKAIEYYEKSLELKKILQDKQGIANTLNNIGEIYKFRGDYPDAIKNYRESYTLKKELNDNRGMANTLNNLGEIYSIWGDYQKALGYYLEASTLWNKLNNSKGMAGAYHNIAEIYKDLNNYEQAEKYYLKALKIQKTVGDMSNMAATLRHLGYVYIITKKYKEANANFIKSLSIEQKHENKSGVASTLVNMGKLSSKLAKYDTALQYYKQALDIYLEIGNQKGAATSYGELGEAYIQLGNFSASKKNFNLSLKIAKEIKILGVIQNDYLSLAKIYQHLGNYRKGLDYYFKYSNIKDTLLNKQIHQQIAELETKYQTQQKEKELLLKDEQLRRKDLEIKQQNLQRKVMLAGLAFVLLLAALIYLNYRQKQKANKILSRQKAEIELKNTEITDSIRYARYIQKAFLPHEKYIHEIFKEIFIYFKPKDIVSGDFYWIAESHQYAYIAAVDATGHGVPGAFLSLFGYNLLNTILKENKDIRPDEILNELNKGFSERMFKEYQEHALRDSMDIALCRIDTTNNKLDFSGAYNPLWIVRKDEIIVIKGDKFPIGSYLENPDNRYANYEVVLKNNDVIYLFSDGYADQFGGEKEKKFKYSQMKELFLKIYKKEMKTQADILDQTLQEWKGDIEQVDDILVIGLKIKIS